MVDLLEKEHSNMLGQSRMWVSLNNEGCWGKRKYKACTRDRLVHNRYNPANPSLCDSGVIATSTITNSEKMSKGLLCVWN